MDLDPKQDHKQPAVAVPINNPFCTSVEIEAACRDFGYPDYMTVCVRKGVQPLNPFQYNCIKGAFNRMVEAGVPI